MPAVSRAQLRWVNSPEGHKALGEKGVEEWNRASTGLALPERVGDKTRDYKKAAPRRRKEHGPTI